MTDKPFGLRFKIHSSFPLSNVIRAYRWSLFYYRVKVMGVVLS